MDAGDFEAACPLLEQSQAADPSSGTLLNLGDCYEHVGRTASAGDAFARAIELARATGRQDRMQVAELRRARLAPRLRRLRLVPPTPPIANLVVRVDEQARPLPSDPLAVDPGTHDIRASAPGFGDSFAQVTAPEAGATLDVAIPQLLPANGASTGPLDDRAARTSGSLDGREIAALACGAVGVVGVIGGSVFGLRSISKHHESDQYCDGTACRDKRGVDAMDSARSAGNLSTASFIVGAAGLGAAAILWFVVPASKPAGTTAELGFGPGAINLRGAF